MEDRMLETHHSMLRPRGVFPIATLPHFIRELLCLPDIPRHLRPRTQNPGPSAATCAAEGLLPRQSISMLPDSSVTYVALSVVACA